MPVQSLSLPVCDAALVDEHDDGLDALLLQLGHEALTVSASSLKVRPATPDGVTIVGVPSSVMPMKPTFTPSSGGSS